MTKPVSVRVDLETSAAYVRYAEGDVAGTIDVWRDGWVAADVDQSGQVLGIEVLDLASDTLEQARIFARSRDLAFPDHLEDVRASA
jgi:uncharacterized protein YuzE